MKAWKCIGIAAAMAGLGACSGEDPGELVPEAYEIVTYCGAADSQGRGSRFTFRVFEDSPLITLTASARPVDPIAEGTRLMIRYRAADPYASGRIELTGLGLIGGGEMEEGQADAGSAITVNSLWRSGQYINLDYCTEASAQAPCRLLLDTATASSARPVLTVVQEGGREYLRRAYASWDIADLWARPGLEGVIVRTGESDQTLFLKKAL